MRMGGSAPQHLSSRVSSGTGHSAFVQFGPETAKDRSQPHCWPLHTVHPKRGTLPAAAAAGRSVGWLCFTQLVAEPGSSEGPQCADTLPLPSGKTTGISSTPAPSGGCRDSPGLVWAHGGAVR